MIIAKHIHKSYNGLAVLKGINIQVDNGKIVSLYGASGSGKTTLLNILSTIDEADDGFIHIESMKRYFGHCKFVKASKWKRLLNYIIDSFTLYVLGFLFGLLIFMFWNNEYFSFFKIGIGYYLLIVLSIVTPILIFFSYYIRLEYKHHVTLGKLITSTLVIHKSGLYPSKDTLLFRTLFRLIPFEPFSLLFSRKGIGWHDSLSQSIVIDKNKNNDFLKELNNVKVMTENDLSAFRNQSIGYVFQFHNLLPEFTALENVCLPGYIKGDDKNKVENKAKELLTTLDLDDKYYSKPSELSGGELQRVAVARALINNPKIIFADEPSGNLDSKNAEYLHHLFIKLRDKYGFTFLIATHNKHLANISDSTLYIKDGIIDDNRID